MSQVAVGVRIEHAVYRPRYRHQITEGATQATPN